MYNDGLIDRPFKPKSLLTIQPIGFVGLPLTFSLSFG